MQDKKIIQRVSYYIIPIWVLLSFAVAWFGSQSWGQIAHRSKNPGSWAMLLLFFVLMIKPISLISTKVWWLKPISVIELPTTIQSIKPSRSSIIGFVWVVVSSISKYWMRYRRELGIATAYLILAHGWLTWIWWIKQWSWLIQNLNQTYIVFWLIGGLCLMIGAITSNQYAVKLLKRNRKLIQRVAYGSLLFGVLHLVWLWQYQYAVIAIIYCGLKYRESKLL